MTVVDLLSALSIIVGCAFYLAGTVGLLRLPDVYTRLHALTKADNLGLGLIILGTALHAPTSTALVRLALIWALVLFASATVSHLIGRGALMKGQEPWEKPS